MIHVVTLLVLVGFGWLTFGKSDWDCLGDPRPTVHLWSGLAAPALLTTNAYLAVFLERREPGFRWNYAEFIHGVIAHSSFVSSCKSLNSCFLFH